MTPKRRSTPAVYLPKKALSESCCQPIPVVREAIVAWENHVPHQSQQLLMGAPFTGVSSSQAGSQITTGITLLVLAW